MIDIYNYNLEEEIIKFNKIDSCANYTPRGFITWYGHEKILKTLYDLDDVSTLKAYIYHGVVIEDSNWSANDSLIDKKFPDYPILTQRKAEADYQKRRCPNRKNIFYSGSLQSMYRQKKNIQLSSNAKGTIAYPVHAAKDAYADFSWEAYADKLKELPEKFQPVNVCLFFKDIQAGLHKVFLDKGFNVYCAGHRCDPDFCDNQYEIMRHHKYITTNAFLGSCLFYGAEMGLKPFLYAVEKEFIYKACDEKNEKLKKYYNDSEPLKKYLEFIKNNIPIYPNTDLNETQKQKILKILGMDEQSSSEEIRKALLNSKYRSIWHKILGIYTQIIHEKDNIFKVVYFCGLKCKIKKGVKHA